MHEKSREERQDHRSTHLRCDRARPRSEHGLRGQAEEEFALDGPLVLVAGFTVFRRMLVRVVSRMERVAVEAGARVPQTRHDVRVQPVTRVRMDHDGARGSREDRHDADEHPQPDAAGRCSLRSVACV